MQNPEESKSNRKRGGPKKAPVGFLTAKEAYTRLGLLESTFHKYVREGRIRKSTLFEGQREGYYSEKEINDLKRKMTLMLDAAMEQEPGTEVRIARVEDTPGVVQVLTVLGWKTATEKQRASWYRVNPQIDIVVARGNDIRGYIHAAPYKPQALAGLMSGAKRSWDMVPDDFYAYKPGSFDLYVGIATRQDLEESQYSHMWPFQLIAGFFSFLEDLAKKGIFIHKLYAVSAEEGGQRLCRILGFELQEKQEGDLFPRYELDLEISTAHFAVEYQEILARYRGRK